jgi:hypothetical protein
LGGEPVTSLPLYGSDRLTAATRRVVIVEGEKACDALHALLGDDPTTAVVATVTGAGAVPDFAVLAALLGLDAYVLWPDNDPPGELHMQAIATRLLEFNQPPDSVRRVRWREAPEKGDASDFVAAGNRVADVWTLFETADAYVLKLDNDQSATTDNTDRINSVGIVSASAGQDDEVWSPRLTLPAAVPAVPPLPPALIPEPLRAWLVEAAQRNCVALEMVAASALVAAGAVIGRSLGIRPGRYDDFVAVPNLWGAIVNRPGTLKTTMIDEGMRPLGLLVAKARKQFEDESEAWAVESAALDAELAAIKKEMEGAARNKKPLDAFKVQLAAKRQERTEQAPNERRYLTHDPTVEKLGELLRDNPRGLLLVRDELSGWLQAFDRPGREGDREFFLEAWNGTSSFTTDRIGRGTIHIPALCLSVFGGIQPGKLRPLVMRALDGGAGDDGLLQRLQVLVWPDRPPPWTPPTDRPDPEARARADAIYAWLDTQTAATVKANTEGTIPYLTFTPPAQAVFDEWRDELEVRLRSDDLGDTPAFAAHLAKYRSLMPALALLFELIAIAGGGVLATGQVGEPAARLAAAWCEYLEYHAKKLYAAELMGGVAVAHLLADKIAAGAIPDGVAVRDVYRAGWSGLRAPERVVWGLDVLAEHGWVRIEQAGDRRPAQLIRLHPDLRSPTKPLASTDETTEETSDE